MALSVNLMRKTGPSTWTEQMGQSSVNGTFNFSALTSAIIPIGANAIRVDVRDEAGNLSSSNVLVFDNGNTTRRFANFKVTDDIGTVTGSIPMTAASPWPKVNDTLPILSATMPVGQIISQGEPVNVNLNCIQSVRLFLAWKAYVDETTTKATINPAATTMDSLALATGQCYFDISTGFINASDLCTVSKQIIAGATTELQGGRIYTMGAKWTDATGTPCTYVAGDERSFVLDTNPPNVAISAPIDGYIYNGNVVVVSGTCTDPVVG